MFKLSRKWKKLSMIFVGMTGMATFSFNCAPSLFESARGGGSGSLDLFSSFEATNGPLTLLTAEQTYQSMLNLTGQSESVVARPEYLSRAGSMASTPSLTNVNSPLLLASTSLAGDVCENLITKETTDGRIYFTAVNFNAGPDITTFQGAVSTLALNFWGRPINGDEFAALNEFYSEFTAGATQNAALTRDLMLGACSAMLSSFDSLVY